MDGAARHSDHALTERKSGGQGAGVGSTVRVLQQALHLRQSLTRTLAERAAREETASTKGSRGSLPSARPLVVSRRLESVTAVCRLV